MAADDDRRTIEELAEQALAVQDACNLSGVVRSFAGAMSRLRVILDEHGYRDTELLNKHPIVQVWADKVSQLAGTQHGVRWASVAYAEVQRLVDRGREPAPVVEAPEVAVPAEPLPDTERDLFEPALAAWLARSQARLNEKHAKDWPTSARLPTQLSADPGGVKYVRIVATDGPSRSAWAFVERATGDIFKSDSWKRPAKGVRGNIHKDQGLSSYGELYRR